jgi:hydrogenase expression/formation protein HypC
MRLVSRDGSEGQAEFQGIFRRVRLDLVPDVRLGDALIVHAGYAIQILDEEAAAEVLEAVMEAVREEP